MSDKISKLLHWCSAEGIIIDRRLSIVESSSGSISVFNTSKEFIAESTMLVTIPKTSILSIRTCAHSTIIISALESKDILIPPYGHEAKLVLALALYTEIVSGSASNWESYLQSLPQETVPIALFWGYRYDDEMSTSDIDGLEARCFLTGTDIELGFRNQETGADILEEISEFYESLAIPIMQGLTGEVSLRGYHYAYSLVSSRAFLLDAYHGLSMVPIADAFNHANDNQAHLESDYDVCMICGSVNECQHDGTQRQTLVCDEYGSDEEESEPNTCEMVANKEISPESEVFNSYGEGLSNGDLLLNYGYMSTEGGYEEEREEEESWLRGGKTVLAVRYMAQERKPLARDCD